ncbi:MAG: DUF917 domain-containing protein, partial [Actinomycetota bacterium]|nr:DUF917 domain-containing protein [Actinomycetota bacterium]
PVEVRPLEELPPQGLIMPGGSIGAPIVGLEKIERGDECVAIREWVEQLRGEPVIAVMASEIGGSNGLVPIAWAARMGLPVVDADGMGRAFPEVQQITMEIAGISASPAVMADERGNVIVFHAADGPWMERLERAATIEFGGTAMASDYLLTVEQAMTATVPGTVSLAIEIGRTIGEAEDDPVGAVSRSIDAARLIDGKIVDVDRRIESGFNRGSCTIEGLGAHAGSELRIDIQNENLIAVLDDRIVATVPDIITVCDAETGEAIHTERLRYGQRVSVIAFPCASIWRTPEGLAIAGPRVFGYEIEYTPVERLHA